MLLSQENNQQVIRFENRHYVWNNCPHDDDENATVAALLQFLADQTGWPVDRLHVVSSATQYTHVRVISSLRGGKGGFGSLLKSQSRQAGAKSTTNFGACRDLQGRRLRHVNDAVAAQHFAEWQERVESGRATEEQMVKALVQTTSGVPGWHLQLPAWSEISKKESRTWQRQYRLWKQSKDQQQAKQRHERELRESRVQHYVDQAAQATASVQASLQAALQEGLQQQRNKRQKREKEPPVALLTLAGDVVLAFNENGVWQIQTKSNFGTFGIVLDKAKLKHDACYYWEIRLVTGGLCQVGWATGKFAPQSETGDGVGDDAHSYSFDGSRMIALHKSESVAYGQGWNAGDVLGCLWNRSHGTLSFSHNGQDLGVAYTIGPGMIVFPAASCNPDEIVELHMQQNEMAHAPTNATVVGDILATEEVSFSSATDAIEQEVLDAKPAPVEQPKAPPAKKTAQPDAPPLEIEPLNLDQFATVHELEAIGLDRLKGALMAVGVKCGGTLTQRAERLMSLKGLDPKDYPLKILAKKN